MKTTEAGGLKGYDGGKKINGHKRYIVVDTLGFLLAVIVYPADLQDQDGACLVLYALWKTFRRLRVIFAESAVGDIQTRAIDLEPCCRTGSQDA